MKLTIETARELKALERRYAKGVPLDLVLVYRRAFRNFRRRHPAGGRTSDVR